MSVACEFGLRREFAHATNALETLVSEEHFDLANILVGRDLDLLDTLISTLCAHRHAKVAGSLIQRHGLDPAKYPLVIEGLKHLTVRYFLKTGDLTVPKLAELMEEDESMLVVLVLGLIKRAARKNRHSLRAQAAYVLAKHPHIATKLPTDLVGELRAERLPPEEIDRFQPVDPAALRLPLCQSSVHLIRDSEGIRSLALDSDAFGLDCEWRPPMLKFQWFPVSILQIATRTSVYLLDLQALKNSESLSAKLEPMFGSSAVKLGVNFAEDRRKLQQSYPAISAFRAVMHNFADLQETEKSGKKGSGLAAITQKVLHAKLCKAEQRSNWQKRPLRLAQMHYAALDAYVQIMIWDVLPDPKPQLTTLV